MIYSFNVEDQESKLHSEQMILHSTILLRMNLNNIVLKERESETNIEVTDIIITKYFRKLVHTDIREKRQNFLHSFQLRLKKFINDNTDIRMSLNDHYLELSRFSSIVDIWDGYVTGSRMILNSEDLVEKNQV